MNKFTDKEYQIYENIAQAKSILRKNNGSIEDDAFLQIVDTTGKDGWTGLLTRFVYKDGIDLDEVLSLYHDLKKSKLDLGKLNKMSYDDVVDQIYSESGNEEDGIYFVGKWNDYMIFHVKNYEDGLKICSPSWCLKTKQHWDYYTTNGYQFVIIKENFANKRGKTKLLTPDSPSYFGGYSNAKKPEVRYGLSYKSPQNIHIFDDNNNVVSSRNFPKGILEEIYRYVKNNPIDVFMIDEEKFTYFRENIAEEFLSENNLGSSWDYSVEAGGSKDYDSIFEDFIQFCQERNFDPFEFFKEFKQRIVDDSWLTYCCGELDYILYKLSGGEGHDDAGIPLSGMFLSERELTAHSYKYVYGFAQNKYGRMYILQSYDNIAEWYTQILVDFSYVFLDTNESAIMSESSFYETKYMNILYRSFTEQMTEGGFSAERKFLDMFQTFFHQNINVNSEYCSVNFYIDQFIETIHNFYQITNEVPEVEILGEDDIEDIKQINLNQLVEKSKITSRNRLVSFVQNIPYNNVRFDQDVIDDILNIDRDEVIHFFKVTLAMTPENINKYNTTELKIAENNNSSEKSEEVLQIRFHYLPIGE